MSFKDFVDKDIDDFRKLKIGLVSDKKEEYSKLVEKIQNEYKLSTDLVGLKEELNKELGNTYRGKHKFDYCLIEDINIDKLRINKSKLKKKIKESFFKMNSELAKGQTELERKIVSGD